jgi:light-regulated signal transduction histidine kinase (bacteriophytochrome)
LELQQTVEDLSRSNLELQQFAYVASHDLREPLRMVVSYTELLAQRYKGNLDEKADKFIRYIVEGGKRMQQLIADLLTYSRVGSKERAFTSVDTAAVVEKTLRSLSKAVEESGAEVLFGELPVVMADELQLGQVFQNLVGNAIKFRTDRTPRVAIRAKISGHEWVFCVEDNGIGIDMEYASRLFQMFHRLHDRSKYEGNGIGLAVSKKIVERHGGRIWFESELGKGAKFFFTLPVAQVGAS